MENISKKVLKISSILLFFVTLFFLVPSSVHAATYCTTSSGNCYVDGTNGLDTNDGKTTTTAWKTIQHAANTVGAGDTVNVKGGITYAEHVTTFNSGTSGNYITYQAWSGTGLPIIKVVGTKTGNGIDIRNSYINVIGFCIQNFGNGINIEASYNYINMFNNIISGNTFGLAIGNIIGTNHVAYNNIVINNDLGGIYPNNGYSTYTADYNLIWNNGSIGVDIPHSPHDVNSDPLFVDSVNNNFTLRKLSPAVNAGVDLTTFGVTTDVLGVARPQGSAYDIGSYEYYDIPVALTSTPTSPSTNTKPTITGTASTIGAASISSVSYSVDAGSWTSNGVTGTSSFSITLPTALSDGSHTIHVWATDSYGNTSDSSLYGTTTFVVDTTGPTAPTLTSPAGYMTSTTPTLVFKKSTDATSGMSSYAVTLDSGKNQNYSISGLPSAGNGTSDDIWRDDATTRVEYLNENDSDSTNDEIHVYFKGLNTQSLSEGWHTWTVTAYDQAGNSTSNSQFFFIDNTSPSFSQLAVANVSIITPNGVYPLAITNRMPAFSGKVTDPYQGSTQTNSNGSQDTFAPVSSGPATVTLTMNVYNQNTKAYTSYLTQTYPLTSIQDISGTDKETRFYVQTPFLLKDGYYQVFLTVTDTAGNRSGSTTFFLKMNYKGNTPTFINTKSTPFNTVVHAVTSLTNTVTEAVSHILPSSAPNSTYPTSSSTSFNFFTWVNGLFSKLFRR
jgi:hypothetical protein